MDKLEPKGKLGAMSTIQAVPVHDGVVADVVNGPEDEVLDWRSVEWRAVEDNVRRLRQRIFMASRAGDLKRVRNLQKLMLRSRSNALVSVRRVTEVNTGRNTPGIDGRVVTLAPVKADLAVWIQRDSKTWCARPVKRVYISKANGKRRPLGIPVIVDRVLQALTVNALEPEWEARFEPKSYGFRPGRGCHDAIEAIHKAVSGKNAKRLWGLDADLTAAFDHIDHGVLLESLGSFPAKETIRGWLTAGVMEDGQITTDAGTPQGGVISPLLLNVALHGLEQAAGVRYQPHGTHAGLTIPGAPILVRYADDLVALCHTGAQAEQVHARLTEWLAPRGLTFNDGKTQTVHVGDGFDFLGFNVRRYRNGKVLCKPSKAAVRRIRERLAAEMRALRGSNAAAVVARLNPIIRGWPTTSRVCPRKRSPRWTTTCGRSPTSGPGTDTRRSRSAGLWPGTSAPTTSPGTTAGYSGTATAASTCASSPGQRSSDTAWSRAGRLRTIQRWPPIGPNADSADRHPSG